MDTTQPSNPPRQSPTKISLYDISKLMSRISLLETQGLGRERDEIFFRNVNTIALGLFRLVVMGEIKKGKSSFINAMCGIPGLVPVHSEVATSTVFKIRYGKDRKYSAFFQKPDASKLEIGEKEVDEYGTETGNPGNTKGVDFISVEAPAPLLRDGLILVDTPGVGGLFKEHRGITFRYAPNADAVFFVTDSIMAPIGDAEVAFLKELSRVTSLVYFVQTQGSMVDSEARRQRMENNIRILVEKAGFKREEIRYFVVDSNLKLEADESKDPEKLQWSGFPALMSFLNNDLKRRKDLNLGMVGIKRAREKFEQIKAEVRHKREINSANTEEKRRTLSKEIESAEMALAEWSNEKKPALLGEFQRTLSADVSDLQAALRLELKPGGRISDQIASIVDEAARKADNAEQLCNLAPLLIQDARAAASECLVKQVHTLESKVAHLIAALAAKVGAQLTSQLSLQPIKSFAAFADTPLANIRLKPIPVDAFSSLRTAMYGGMAGCGMATLAGMIIGSIIPVAGTIIGGHIGALIAGAWGGAKALQIQNDQELRATQQQLSSFIDRELGNILVLAEAEFSKSTRELEAKATETIRDLVTTTQNQLLQQRQAIQKREKADAEGLVKEAKQLAILEKAIAEVEKLLVGSEAAVGIS